jgi:hypothetical protein
MRDIHKYFDYLAGILQTGGHSFDEIEFIRMSKTSGFVDGTIYFYDGGRLEFTEDVSIEHSKPVKHNYRYQYVRSENELFRYDNAPHHPNLSNFPHHKHMAGKTIAALEPSLSQVLDEIARLMEEQPAEPPAKAKRRRAGKAPRRSK